MPIVLKKGDLFSANAEIIAHGCNCRGGFGSGIAGQIAKRYPKARDEYLRKFNTDGWKLGEVQLVQISDAFYIANMATQDAFGYTGGQYGSYEAIDMCLELLISNVATASTKYSIAMPRIGSGLAGLEWPKVQDILIKIALRYPDVPIEVYSL